MFGEFGVEFSKTGTEPREGLVDITEVEAYRRFPWVDSYGHDVHFGVNLDVGRVRQAFEDPFGATVRRVRLGHILVDLDRQGDQHEGTDERSPSVAQFGRRNREFHRSKTSVFVGDEVIIPGTIFRCQSFFLKRYLGVDGHWVSFFPQRLDA